MELKFDDLFDYEVSYFKENFLHNKNYETVEEAVEGGFFAAVGGQGIKDIKSHKQLINTVSKAVTDFLKLEPAKTAEEFDKRHKKLRNIANDEFIKLKKIHFSSREGYGQKIINVAFKNIYCSDREKYDNNDIFKFGHLIIDSYTLKWFFSVKEFKKNFKEYYYLSTGKKFNKTDFKWTKMADKDYEKIQSIIRTKNIDLPLGKNNIVKLSNEPFKNEFIIWHQEKINKIANDYNKLDNKEKERT